MWELAAQVGPSGLLTLVAVSLLRGWLVPRSQLLREIGYLERANQALEATVVEKDRQLQILLGHPREPTS